MCDIKYAINSHNIMPMEYLFEIGECFFAYVQIILPFLNLYIIRLYRIVYISNITHSLPKYLSPISAENITKIALKTFISHVTDII